MKTDSAAPNEDRRWGTDQLDEDHVVSEDIRRCCGAGAPLSPPLSVTQAEDEEADREEEEGFVDDQGSGHDKAKWGATRIGEERRGVGGRWVEWHIWRTKQEEE